jgi:hypothetical protein
MDVKFLLPINELNNDSCSRCPPDKCRSLCCVHYYGQTSVKIMVYQQILQRLLYIKFYDNSLCISIRAGMTNRQAEVENVNSCSRSALTSWEMCRSIIDSPVCNTSVHATI